MAQILDLQEWDECLGKMIRYHSNISSEIRDLILKIRAEVNTTGQDLVPTAEERSNYGKTVKQSIRSMWGLEYEIEDIQVEFAKSIGEIDLSNLTDDFVEDVMLQSKPLQSILHAIRKRQRSTMEVVKKDYWEKVKDLEPLKVPRPPKPEPKPAEPEKKAEGETKAEGADKKPEGEAAPAAAPTAEAPKAPEAPAPVEAAA